MKYLILILFLSSLVYAQEIVVQKSDSDSLWYDIDREYTLDEDVIVIKNIAEFGFILRQGNKEFICRAIPEGFHEKIKGRKKKYI